MMMRIDETRTNEFISAIDDGCLCSGKIFADLRYLVAFDKDVAFDGVHSFVAVMDESGTALE